MQDVGIKYANAHPNTDANTIANVIQVAKMGKPEEASQANLFGEDSSYMQMTDKLATTASQMQKEIKDKTQGFALINSRAKLEQANQNYGMNVKDIGAAQRLYADLKAEQKRWDNWYNDKELVNKVYERAGIEKNALIEAAQVPNEVIEENVPDNTVDMFAKEEPVVAKVSTTEKIVPQEEAMKAEQPEPAKGKEVIPQVKETIVMDEETYLAQHGASRQDIGESALHKNIPQGKIRKQILKPELERNKKLLAKREELRKEYQAKIESGEIRKPTRTESLITTANRMPELESTQAARRLLGKQGIKWESEQVVTKNEEVVTKEKPVVPAEVATIKGMKYSVLNLSNHESWEGIAKNAEEAYTHININKGDTTNLKYGRLSSVKEWKKSQAKTFKEEINKSDIPPYVQSHLDKGEVSVLHETPEISLDLIQNGNVITLSNGMKLYQDNLGNGKVITIKNAPVENHDTLRELGLDEHKTGEFNFAPDKNTLKQITDISPIVNIQPSESDRSGNIFLSRIEKQPTYKYSEEEVSAANKTSRATGAVGMKAIVPKKVAEIAKKTDTILDYGAGIQAMQAKQLKEQGFNVTAYDFGNNIKEGIHQTDALARKYDIVYASNVLNVQSSEKMLRQTLSEIVNSMNETGKFIANYPESPRKTDLKANNIENIIKEYFGEIKYIGGTKNAPIFQATKPIIAPTTKVAAPLFNKANPYQIPQGMTVTSIVDHIENLKKKYKGMPEYYVVATEKELVDFLTIEETNLPEKEKVMGRSGKGYIPAAFYNGIFYFVAENLSSLANIEKSILHEGFHKGFIDTFGNDGKKILKAVYYYYDKKGEDFTKLAKLYGMDLEKEKDRLELANERLAELAKNPKEAPGLWARVVTMIKSWLIRNGFKVKLSDTDIANLITESHRSLKEQMNGGRLFINGQAVASKKEKVQTETPEFKKWFGDSKVVDENGKPLVVYHGTPEAEFFEFDKGKRGTGPLTGNPIAKYGYFFTPDADYAKSYLGDSGNIIEAYIRINKPYKYDMFKDGFKLADKNGIAVDEKVKPFIDDIKRKGYDGLEMYMGGKVYEYMVFEPTQIKSATENIGTFDAKNPDIRFSREELTPPYWTYALFDTNDTLSGRPIKAGEEVFFFPDTTEMYDKQSQLAWERKQLESNIKTSEKKLQMNLFDENQTALFSRMESDIDNSKLHAESFIDDIENNGTPEQKALLESAKTEFEKINSKEGISEYVQAWYSAFKNRKEGDIGLPVDESLKSRILGSPEFTFAKSEIGALNRIIQAAKDRLDDSMALFNMIMGKNPSSNKSNLTSLDWLWKNDKSMYAKVKKVMNDIDRNKTRPFNDKLADKRSEIEGKIALANKQRDMPRKEGAEAPKELANIAGLYQQLSEVSAQIDEQTTAYLKKLGLNQQGIQAYKDFRKITNIGLERIVMELSAIINEYDKKGVPIPNIVVRDENGNKYDISLKTAVNRMNDLRDTFFPRERKHGKYGLYSEKSYQEKVFAKQGELFDGEKFKMVTVNELPPDNQMFTTKEAREKYKAELIRKGYPEEQMRYYLTPVQPESEMTNLLGDTMKIESMVEQALSSLNTKTDKFNALTDISGMTVLEADYTDKDGNTIPQLVIRTKDKKYDAIFKSLSAEFKDAKIGRYKDQTLKSGDSIAWHFNNPTEEMKDRLLEAINSATNVNESISLEFATNLTLELADVLRRAGWKSSMIARDEGTGINVARGYEEDPLRAINAYVKKVSSGISKARFAKRAIGAMLGTDMVNFDDIKKQMTDKAIADNDGNELSNKAKTALDKNINKEYQKQLKENRVDVTKQHEAYTQANSYILDQLRSRDEIDGLINGIRAFAAVKYLGLNVMSCMVNYTTLLTSVPANMNQETKYEGDDFGKRIKFKGMSLTSAPQYIGKAWQYYAQYKWGDKKKLPPEIIDLFDTIKNKGWNNAQFNETALAYLQSKVPAQIRRIIMASMKMFAYSEQMIRVASIAGSYIYMAEQVKRQGGKITDSGATLLADRAHGTSDFANGVYGPIAKPFYMQGGSLGAKALNSSYIFLKFPHTYMMSMYDLGVKKHNYQAAAWMILMPTILAGVGANPLYQLSLPLLWLIKALTGSDDPEKGLYDFLNENLFGIGDWLEEGAFGKVTGINIRRSLAIELPSLVDNVTMSVFKDLWEAGKYFGKGEIGRAAERALPRVIASPIRAFREAEEGITTRSNTPLYFGKERIYPTKLQTIGRMAGINPMEIERKRQEVYKGQKLVSEYNQRKQDISNEYRKYFLKPADKRNAKDYQKIMQDVKKFNQRLKEHDLLGIIPPITGVSLKTARKRMLKPSKYELMRARKERLKNKSE
jgi:propanediol dehydratase small subunit/type III secretory pathway component EscR